MIEKLVAEFDITALELLGDVFVDDFIPYGGFKVRIYESQDKEAIRLTGFTNLKILDSTGHYEGAVGFSNTMEGALEETINYFIEKVNDRLAEKGALLTADDFKIVSYDEF